MCIKQGGGVFFFVMKSQLGLLLLLPPLVGLVGRSRRLAVGDLMCSCSRPAEATSKSDLIARSTGAVSLARR